MIKKNKIWCLIKKEDIFVELGTISALKTINIFNDDICWDLNTLDVGNTQQLATPEISIKGLLNLLKDDNDSD